MKKTYALSTQDVMRQLGVTEEGLSTAEAQSRREKYGPNKLKEAEKATWFQRFMEQLKDPMLIILMIAAVVSAATTVLSYMQNPGHTGELLEGLVEEALDGTEQLRTDVDYTEFILERTNPVTVEK